jgi:hypothetical protein
LYSAILSDSRTAIISIFIFFLFCQINLIKKLKKGIVILPILFLFLSFYLANQSDNIALNLVLSNRPTDYNDFLNSVTFINYFIGAPIAEYRVDNSYLVGFFSTGAVGMVVFFLLFYKALKSEYSTIEIALFLSLLIYGVFESLIVRVEFPVVILFYYIIFFKDNNYVIQRLKFC